MSLDINEINRKSGLASKNINGTEYTIHLLPASIGLSMTVELGKLFGPSIGAGFDGINHDELLHGSPTTFSGVAQLLSTQLTKVNIIELVQALLGNLEADGKKVNFDNHFRANYGDLIKLIEFALRENFESFFTGTGLSARMREIMDLMSIRQQELEESLEQ